MRKVETSAAISAAILQLESVWSRLTFYGLDSEWCNAEVNSVVNGMAYGKAPHHARQYLRGYWHGRTRELYESEVFFAHVAPDGTLWTPDKREIANGRCNADLLLGRDSELGWHSWPAGHFWRACEYNPDRGGKRYFVMTKRAKESCYARV